MKAMKVEEPLISFETAKLAKEKGADLYSHVYYTPEGKFWPGFSSCMKDYEDKIKAPPQSVLQKWLREEKGVSVIIHKVRFRDKYYSEIHASKRVIDFSIEKHHKNTYEEALEQGLLEALKREI